MTQEQLAENAELSVQHIGALEKGAGNPTLNSLERIASALSIGIEELFALEEFKRTSEEMRKELISFIQGCSDEQLQRLYAISRLIS